jgi:deoxyribonuclease V
VGVALRTRDRVSPVYVSPGHLMDLSTAIDLILRLTPSGTLRLPETTRRAHALVNIVRRTAEAAQ